LRVHHACPVVGLFHSVSRANNKLTAWVIARGKSGHSVAAEIFGK
jgi:hypothetical protein